jgi:sterol desaturase/sphingolipid hydroxylase (fatty acid hydroxylase superfamily)
MHDLVLPAIPFFVLFLVLEVITLRHAGEHDDLVGYEPKDTATSLTMGLTSVVVGAAWGLVAILVYAGVYSVSPWQLPTDAWWTYGLLFLADDLAFYWYHRLSHEVRVFWAAHVVHHSSQHFNLSTALRQPVVPMMTLPFWLPLAPFFPPWMIFGMQSVSLIYQFGLHTERIGRLPRPVEAIFNTPSHHRVHHGAQQQYLDRNYGGILIVWDRLFGTFEAEHERVRYGLTTNLETHHPVVVATHEWRDIARDLRASGSWRERLAYLFAGPGWRPGAPGRGLAHDSAPPSTSTVPAWTSTRQQAPTAPPGS